MKFFKRTIIFVFALAIFVLSPARCFAEEEKTKPVDENAKSAILMCMDTGEIIYESNAYEHLSPASVTKIMSILLFLKPLTAVRLHLPILLQRQKMQKRWAARRYGLRLEKR